MNTHKITIILTFTNNVARKVRAMLPNSKVRVTTIEKVHSYQGM